MTQWLIDLKTSLLTKWHAFIESYSNIHIYTWVVLSVALIFVILHYLRRFPIIRNVSILMSFIPVLVHELGHAITATLTRSRVSDIHIVLTHYGQTKTGSQGFATTEPRGRLSQIVITFMGYVFPPLMFFLGFYFVNHQQSYIYITILAFFAIYYLIKSSQKWIPFVILVILTLSGFELKTADSGFIFEFMHIGYSVMLGLLLGEIIQSIIITTQMTFKGHGEEWDGSAMRDATFIPVFVWWLIWTFISVGLVLKSLL